MVRYKIAHMRKLAFLLLSIGFVIATNSCKKSHTAAANVTLQGTWELTSVSGMGGTTNVQAGLGNACNFSNGTFREYSNNSLARTGSYTITSSPGVPASGTIDFNNGASMLPAFHISQDNTLVIDFGSAFDAPINTYHKQ